MNVPCKECIVLAICRNKALIVCESLFRYRWEHQKECLKDLEEYLPKWRTKIIIKDTYL